MGSKSPHWTGTANSPATFGHFGAAGSMLWVDPAAGCGLVALTDRAFDDWPDALAAWSELSDAVVAEWAGARGVMYSLGDRVRCSHTAEDGLPLVRYGFVRSMADATGPVVVMFDGEIGGEEISIDQLEPVTVTSLDLCLDGDGLLDDPELRRGLAPLWQAEAEDAGLDVAGVDPPQR